MANTITNTDNDKNERVIRKVVEILDSVTDCIAKQVPGATLAKEREYLAGIVENCLEDLTRAKLLLWVVIPIGTRVVIKDHPGVSPRGLVGCEAMVIGYEHNPPKAISMLHLEIPGDVMFKWPSLFPWMVEVQATKGGNG